MWKKLLLIACSLELCASGGAHSPMGDVEQQILAGREALIRAPANALVGALRHRAILSTKFDARSRVLLAFHDWVAAAALVYLNQPKKASAFDEEGLAIAKEMAPDSLLFAELLLAKADIAAAFGDVQTYIKEYQAAFLAFKRAGDLRGQALALQDIAASYLDAGDYKTALKYCEDAAALFSVDSTIKSSIFTNRGIALVNLGRFQEAERSYNLAVVSASASKNARMLVQVLLNLAQSQVMSGELGRALSTSDKGLSLAVSGSSNRWKPALLGVKAQVALKSGNIVRAQQYIEDAFTLIRHTASPSSMRDLHQVAYEIYRARGDTAKALAHLEAFKKLDDQARALAASTNAALMSARFDFANQDLKIVRLRAGQAERDAALARTQGRFHSALIGGLAFISVLLALGFVSIRRSRNQVRDANRELQGTNAELEKALAAKSTFLATTSHEIRTPLNGILGMTQVLLANRAVEPEVRSRVQLIHGAGETMRALVDDILDMAKMETGELKLHPAPMDLRRLLEEAGAVWTGQAETKGIGLVLRLDECPAGIIADEVRLRQIVFNLMSNAIKFTDRGQVRLSARAEPRDDGEALVLVIEDSGIGIPPDRLAEIFESFRQVDGGVTRRHGGTGLGLAICRNLARAMGGDVTVASVLGTGSSFTIAVPLARAHLPDTSSRARRVPAAADTLADARLLLLDPNPLAQGILRALLGPQVRALDVAADEEAASTLLEAGGIQHLLADAAAFGFDPAACLRFVDRHEVAHVTLLWPSPGADVQAAIAADPIVRLLAKPIAAADLLAGLRMSYEGLTATRDIAA